LKFHILKN